MKRIALFGFLLCVLILGLVFLSPPRESQPVSDRMEPKSGSMSGTKPLPLFAPTSPAGSIATESTPSPQSSAPSAPAGQAAAEETSLSQKGRIVLDTAQSPDHRRAVLAQLTQAGAEALPVLAQIAASNFEVPKNQDPHSIAALKYRFEKGLRITALEALDEQAAKAPTVRGLLRAILAKQSDVNLQFLAGLSLSGIDQGRPGKLGRFIDQVFEESVPQ